MKTPSLGYTDNFPNRQMWQEIANEFHGEFRISHDTGGELEIHNTLIPYERWEIRISVSDSRPLKFQVNFAASQEFDLVMSWEDTVGKVLKVFQKPEVTLGWKEFDNKYLIKTNRSDLTKDILTRSIQETILKYNIYSISYQTDKKARTAELISVIQRGTRNKEMVTELIAMHTVLINNLVKSRVIN